MESVSSFISLKTPQLFYTIAGAFKTLPGLWKDEQIASHAKVTERVHAAGGKIAAQLYHAGRETTSEITEVQPIAPSAVKEQSMSEIPRELTIEEIHELVEQFGDAAERAKKAGFDAVEMHGAHGYLIGAFVSPLSNLRHDKYGGSITNRARFAVEILQNIRKKCGEEFPVIYRMSTVEYAHGGLAIEEAKTVAMILEDAGIDAIHCSQGIYVSTHAIIPSSIVPRAAYVDNAAAIKSVVDIPVIAVGRINDPRIAESVIVSGKADLVAMGRASLADPMLPKKTAEGREDEIIRCIGCVQGCVGEHVTGRYTRCLVNPVTGMLDEYDLTPTKAPKTVLVIGGGISGCETAIAAALKGHKVTLAEKTGKLGGQWVQASIPIGKSEFTSLINWQTNELRRLGVEIRMNILDDKKLIEKTNPDILVAATGSRPIIPSIPGSSKAHVKTAHEVLNGDVPVGKHAVVIGGGLIGAETADWMAEQGAKVTMIEMLPEIVKDGEHTPNKYLKERLTEYQVDIYTSTEVTEIRDDCVIARKGENCIEISDVDMVVMAVGVEKALPEDKIFDSFQGRVIYVGDARTVKNGFKNMLEAFETGLKID